MSLYTDNTHATTTQPPRVKDMMSHALPHCVSELPASGVDEDAPPSREPGPTATHSPSDNMGAAVAMDDELRECDTMVSFCSYYVPFYCTDLSDQIRVQASRTVTHQSRKRKQDQADSDKENISLTRHPAAKRICREKTGTEWQTVLDVVKFGEEQRERSGY
jgi:hypothetical protein